LTKNARRDIVFNASLTFQWGPRASLRIKDRKGLPQKGGVKEQELRKIAPFIRINYNTLLNDKQG
jgi:hypothetical protein